MASRTQELPIERSDYHEDGLRDMNETGSPARVSPTGEPLDDPSPGTARRLFASQSHRQIKSRDNRHAPRGTKWFGPPSPCALPALMEGPDCIEYARSEAIMRGTAGRYTAHRSDLNIIPISEADGISLPQGHPQTYFPATPLT